MDPNDSQNLINNGLPGDTVAVCYYGHGDVDVMGFDATTWKSLLSKLPNGPGAFVASACHSDKFLQALQANGAYNEDTTWTVSMSGYGTHNPNDIDFLFGYLNGTVGPDQDRWHYNPVLDIVGCIFVPLKVWGQGGKLQ